MIVLRPAAERGHTRFPWLDSRHSFSFGEYYDPRHMGVSSLRVLNEDKVVPGGGFATHGHRDMEIVSYVLAGALEHKDSMGNGSVIRPGDVQRMSAGSGVLHSEFNPSGAEPVHFLQVWLQPNRRGIEPSYAQQHFSADERRGRLCLLVSPDGRDGSISAHQDAFLYGAVLEGDAELEHPLQAGRRAYVHVVRGAVALNGHELGAGDGARVEGELVLRLGAHASSELLVFDLP